MILLRCADDFLSKVMVFLRRADDFLSKVLIFLTRADDFLLKVSIFLRNYLVGHQNYWVSQLDGKGFKVTGGYARLRAKSQNAPYATK